MAKIEAQRDSALKLERAIIDKVGGDPTQVLPGTVSIEVSDGGARVTWTGCALLPSDEFMELFNRVGVKPA